jgi:hypothetical protein
MGYGTKKMIKFNQKCEMLAELWSSYKSDIKFADFFEYNNLGLPLAFMIQEKIVKKTPAAEVYINQTFELLHEALGLGPVDENWDYDYANLEDMIGCAQDEEDDV